MVAGSKFHTEGSQILEAAVQNSVARKIRLTGFVFPYIEQNCGASDILQEVPQ
jgi:hypothetical protein